MGRWAAGCAGLLAASAAHELLRSARRALPCQTAYACDCPLDAGYDRRSPRATLSLLRKDCTHVADPEPRLQPTSRPRCVRRGCASNRGSHAHSHSTRGSRRRYGAAGALRFPEARIKSHAPADAVGISPFARAHRTASWRQVGRSRRPSRFARKRRRPGPMGPGSDGPHRTAGGRLGAHCNVQKGALSASAGGSLRTG